MDQRAAELLMLRARRLVFGAYGYTDDAEGSRQVRFGGTGLFVAPFLGLTAAHVTRDHFNVEQHHRVEDLDRLRATAKGYFVPPHSVALFQVSELPGVVEHSGAATWLVRRTWQSSLTDLSLLFAFADEGPTTAALLGTTVRHFKWSLQPPAVGSEVVMLGFPDTVARAGETQTNFQIEYTLQAGRVTEVFPIRRDAGMFSFPCFVIDQEVGKGFSGGPVFQDDLLCGIVSGVSFGSTYAAALWPLCLAECQYPDMSGELGRPHTVGKLIDEGLVTAIDWQTVRGRLAVKNDERGRQIAYLKD